MTRKQFSKSIPLFTVITYLVMVLVNALANILPINGRGTGEISDSYENLFAPAGITFSIWALIYLLLLGFTLYQLTYYKHTDEAKKRLYEKIGLTFSISSIANTIWILAWHYDFIFISLLLMICILISLIRINYVIRKVKFKSYEYVLIRLPFTIYLGWITVATIANVTTFLVDINWSRYGLSEYLWTNIIILIGTLIATSAMFFYKSKSYGIVVIWAYLGIFIKHISPNGYNNMYPAIIVTVIFSIVILILGEVILMKNSLKKMKTKGTNDE